MVRVRMEFPEDIAAEKAEEAKAWVPGTPMVWEAEEYHVKKEIKKDEEGNAVITTPHIKVVLAPDEIEKIKEL